MNEPKFTKGEWEITRTQSIDAEYGVVGTVVNLVIGGYSHPMAVCGMACSKEMNKRFEENEANVHLMKTAPKLYKKLQDILTQNCGECCGTVDVGDIRGKTPCEKGETCPHGMDDVQALLSEARGEE